MEIPEDLAATPGVSWADETHRPSLPLSCCWSHMEDVRVSPLLEFIWEEMLQEQGGDFNENEESADSQFLLPDNKEVDSNSLASISWAAKHSATS